MEEFDRFMTSEAPWWGPFAVVAVAFAMGMLLQVVTYKYFTEKQRTWVISIIFTAAISFWVFCYVRYT
jgi:hypothetical protein